MRVQGLGWKYLGTEAWIKTLALPRPPPPSPLYLGGIFILRVLRLARKYLGTLAWMLVLSPHAPPILPPPFVASTWAVSLY